MHPYTQDVHVLLPETCKYVTLPGQKDLVDVIKALGVEDYPELSDWAQCNHKYAYRREAEVLEGKRDLKMLCL